MSVGEEIRYLGMIVTNQN